MLKPAEWVDQCGDYLYRYAVSPLRNGDAAEEVVQEMFVAAPRHVDQYEAKGSARAWLLGIFKRKNIDLIRARNRTTSLADEFVPRQFRLVLSCLASFDRPAGHVETRARSSTAVRDGGDVSDRSVAHLWSAVTRHSFPLRRSRFLSPHTCRLAQQSGSATDQSGDKSHAVQNPTWLVRYEPHHKLQPTQA
jgi:hypothetical protein